MYVYVYYLRARAASAYSREESRRLERFREREGLAETRNPPDAPRMGRSSSRIASVTATPRISVLEFVGKSE